MWLSGLHIPQSYLTALVQVRNELLHNVSFPNVVLSPPSPLSPADCLPQKQLAPGSLHAIYLCDHILGAR